MRSNTLLILAIIAVTAGGAMYMPASAPADTARSAPAERPAPATPAESPHDGTTDALTLLADYFAVDISPEAFERQVESAAASLPACAAGSGSGTAAACAASIEVVRDFCRIDFGPSAEIDAGAIERDLDRFDPAAAGRIAARMRESLGPSPASPQRERFRALDRRGAVVRQLRRVADAHGPGVRFVIVTLPDPIDSHMRWEFDAMLDAVQAAAAGAGYKLDRFYLPDWDPSRDAASRPQALLRSHEENPGVVLMRRSDWSGVPTEMLALLIVPEAPTTGLHKPAFVKAADLVAQWSRSGRSGRAAAASADVRVVGPMYSGSRDSLTLAIDAVNARASTAPARFRIVSGSATATSNLTVIGRHAHVSSFSATVRPDSQLEKELLAFAASMRRDGRVARLVESNTGWGVGQRVVGPNATGARDTLRTDYIDIPFPLHISRLQALPEASAAPASAVPSRFLNLSFAEPQPRDQLPVVTPRTTLPSVQLVMAGLLDEIRRERVTSVMITATDARDRLFLAHQLRTSVPDVMLLTLEADLLYTHPTYATDMHGMLVASSYPLFAATPYWRDAPPSRQRRLQFRSTSAQGVYNAMLAQLTDSADDLLDYTAVAPDCAGNCTIPPVWISVVGHDGLWPLRQTTPPDSDGYLFTPPEHRAWRASAAAAGLPSEPVRPRDPGLLRPSGPAFAVFLIVVLWTSWISGAFLLSMFAEPGTRAPRGSARWVRRVREELAAAVAGPLRRWFELTPEPGRHRYLLACFATGLFVNAFFILIATSAIRAEWALGRAWSPTIAVSLVAATASLILTFAAWVSAARDGISHDRFGVVAPDRAVMTLMAVAATVLLVTYAWQILHLTAADAALFVSRSVYPANRVSPALPILAVAGAIQLWALVNMRRLGMPKPERINERLTLVRNLIAFDDAGARDAKPCPPGDDLSSRPAFLIALSVLLLWVFVTPRSHEGRAFDWLYWSGCSVVYALVITGLARLLSTWRDLKRVLRLLAWHPLLDAFRRLPPGTFKSTMTTQAPDLAELAPLVDRCRGVAQRRAAAVRKPVEVVLAEAEPAWAGGAFTIPPDLMPDEARELLREQPPAPAPTCQSIDATFQRELAECPGVAWSRSETWTLLSTAIEAATRQLRPFWIRRAPVPVELAPSEEAAAIAAGLAVREVLARLTNGLIVVIGSLFLLLASHTLFPFYPRQLLIGLSWLFILAAVFAAIGIFSGIDRDAALSRMTGTEPGRLNWDATMVKWMLGYVVVPLVGLLAVQFPQIGETLLRWVQPVQKALP